MLESMNIEWNMHFAWEPMTLTRVTYLGVSRHLLFGPGTEPDLCWTRPQLFKDLLLDLYIYTHIDLLLLSIHIYVDMQWQYNCVWDDRFSLPVYRSTRLSILEVYSKVRPTSKNFGNLRIEVGQHTCGQYTCTQLSPEKWHIYITQSIQFQSKNRLNSTTHPNWPIAIRVMVSVKMLSTQTMT